MKIEELKYIIKNLGEVSIAFSGGVDSSLVSKISYETLGSKATAITVASEFTSEDDILEAIKTAKEIGIRHKIIKIRIIDQEIEKNNKSRCYICKKKILSSIPGKNIVDGTNADDDTEERPGIRALEEYGVISPLKKASIGKSEIRKMAKELGLSNYNKKSNSCLATRIPFNSIITREKLAKIEITERILKKENIFNTRARLKNNKLTIEIPTKYLKKYENSLDRIKEKIYETGIESIETSERHEN